MSARLRIVIDTNIFISSILFKGEANKLVDLWQKDKFLFLMSPEILKEYINVLSSPKFKLTGDEIRHIIHKELLPFVSSLVVEAKLNIIETDPSDNEFLSLAAEGKADYIVSGDKHLLKLNEYGKIRILSLKNFLSLF
jgi:uncharacterized protein